MTREQMRALIMAAMLLLAGCAGTHARVLSEDDKRRLEGSCTEVDIKVFGCQVYRDWDYTGRILW